MAGKEWVVQQGALSQVGECVELLLQSDPWKTFRYTERELIARIEAALDGLFVVCADDRVIGFLLYKPQGFSGAPEVSLLCVSGEFQKRGVGAALMRRAEELAFSGEKNLMLRVSDFTGAQGFYERLGFVECGVLRDWNVLGKHEVIMRKSLGPRMG